MADFEKQNKNNTVINSENLKKLLEEKFKGIDFEMVIGYGSGVFPQKSYNYVKIDGENNTNQKNPMVDLIFVVDDILEFHQQNQLVNPSHYSGLGKILGPQYLSFLQQHIIPMHFNPLIELTDTIQIKYGVIEKRKFIRDLKNWDTLICAGRLHKPVKLIIDNDPLGQIKEAMKVNLIQATCVTFLLNYDDINKQRAVFQEQQQQKTDFQSYISQSNNQKSQALKQDQTMNILDMNQFYFTVASLSYVGDVRYSLGAENANKVENIIEGNRYNFDKIYLETIFNEKPLCDICDYDPNNEILQIYDIESEQTTNNLINQIPVRLATEFTGVEKDCYESLKKIHVSDVQKVLSESLKKKNGYYSKRMLLYNVLSTSPVKNAIYAIQKLKKGIFKR